MPRILRLENVHDFRINQPLSFFYILRKIYLGLDIKNFVFRHHVSIVRGISELKQMSAIKVCNKILILLFQPEIATQVDDVQQIIKKLYSSFLLDHAGVNSTFIIRHQLLQT